MFENLEQKQKQISSDKEKEEQKEAKHHNSLVNAFEHRLEELKGIGIQRAKRKRIFLILLAIFSIIMVASVSTLVYTTWPDAKTFVLRIYNNKFKKDSGVMCSADAKQCPDGSYVSRVAPSCEFAECPEVVAVCEEGKNIGIENKCCDKLKETSSFSLMDGSCDEDSNIKICINCPNGECGQGEDKCNCPEDCGELDPTADWQTYQSEEYKYKFKHPENIVFQHNSDRIIIEKDGEEYLSFNLAEMNNMPLDDSNKETIEEKDVLFDGYAVYVKVYHYLGIYLGIDNDEDYWVKFFDSNNKVIYVATMDKDKYEEAKNLFVQILPTFEWLKDSDGDGLLDEDEVKYSTDINNPDTDGDSYLDGEEVKNGYNPNGSGKL